MYNIVTGSNLNLNNIGKNLIQQDFGDTLQYLQKKTHRGEKKF